MAIGTGTGPSFPGFPPFLEAAAAELGLPRKSTDDARRQPAISQLASLVGQASYMAPDKRGPTLERARELRDCLAVALHAAEAMIAEVDSDGPDPEPDEESPRVRRGPGRPRKILEIL